jgi:hypothetical protein
MSDMHLPCGFKHYLKIKTINITSLGNRDSWLHKWENQVSQTMQHEKKVLAQIRNYNDLAITNGQNSIPKHLTECMAITKFRMKCYILSLIKHYVTQNTLSTRKILFQTMSNSNLVTTKLDSINISFYWNIAIFMFYSQDKIKSITQILFQMTPLFKKVRMYNIYHYTIHIHICQNLMIKIWKCSLRNHIKTMHLMKITMDLHYPQQWQTVNIICLSIVI